VSLAGEGAFASKVRGLVERVGKRDSTRIFLDSLPMIATAIQQFEAVAFLPLEANNDLEKAGFTFLQTDEMEELTRNYRLIHSTRSAAIRSEIHRVAEILAELIQ
ncbi:MAG: hypothetical protein KJT03_18700, partial [Verrucomicrobiae bacterium]|nr:hypothetical protein [Verrucomicrobiae bacterium]